MRRKRKSPLGEPILPFRIFRLNLDPATGEFAGGGGGTTTTQTQEPTDIPPVNGGPDRSFEDLANATIDDPTQQAGGTTTTAATQPPAQRQAPADPNQRAGVTQTQQGGGQNDWQSIRDAASAFGYQVPQGIQDDRAFLMHLLQQAQGNRQADFYAQLGRQLAPQAQGIQQYLGQQRQTQQAPARQPWEAPEFDERWAGLVDRDPSTGLFVAKQGVPHEIAQKVNAFVEWKANYDRNPASVLNAMVERAKDIASSTFREQFAEQQRQATIGQIVQENSAWLYQKDQGGQAIVGYNGQYVPTPVGARYLYHLQAVKQMGVTDPRHQDTLAKNLVRAEFAGQQQAQQQQTQQANNPQTQQALTRTNVNPLQAQPPQQRRQNPAATEPDAAGLSLAEMMRRDLAANGVTDADFANLGE